MKIAQKHATALTIWTFFVVGISGALIFFGIKSKPLILSHEYIGLVFLASVVLHSLANFRAFTSYFSIKKGLIFGLSFLILTAAFIAFYPNNSNSKGALIGKYESVFNSNSIAKNLDFIGVKEAKFMEFCENNRLDCSNLDQNLAQFTKANGTNPRKFLSDILSLKEAKR